MTTATRIPDDYYLRVIVEERIAELWRWRSWYRRNRGALWTDLRSEHTAELRALVRLLRQARKAATPDPVDAYKAGLDYHDWQAGR
jgi:hypothetical protein